MQRRFRLVSALTLASLLGSACSCPGLDGLVFACNADDECAQGFACRDNVCTSTGGAGGGGGASTCRLSTECAAGEFCLNGACLPKQSPGASCTRAEECASAHCADFVCCDSECTDACGSCALPGTTGTCSPEPLGTARNCDPYLCDGLTLSCPTTCTGSSMCVVPLFCDATAFCAPSLLPRSVVPPSLEADGGFQPGNEITASDGTWAASSGGPITITHRWLRCAADGGACVPLTTTGMLSGADLQTDATRTAAVQGDGLAPESSTGTWSGTTNLAVNGGLEASTLGWAVFSNVNDGGPAPSLARNLADHKFGTASLQVTAPGADANEGAALAVSGIAAGLRYTASAWIKGPAGATLCLAPVEADLNGALLRPLGAGPVTVTAGGAWQRVVRSGVTGANTRSIGVAVETCAAGAQALVFGVDGVQVERTSIATPYVDTTTATVSRSPSTLTGPTSLVTPAQGWLAFRARPQWSPSTALDPYPTLFFTGTAVTNKLNLYYDRAGAQYALERNNGQQNTATAARTTVAGTADTVIATWSASQLGVSVNGGMLGTLAASELPANLPATFTLGNFDGELLWAAIGSGALSAADVTALAAFGDTDPTFAALPALPAMLWPASSLSYEALVTGASYTPGAADLGSTLRLEVTATNMNGTTVALSEPRLILPLPPVSTSAPTITIFNGGWYAGAVLNSSQGGWTGASTFAYRWQRCDAMGMACADAGGMGATTNRYTVDAADVGATLVVTVTASNLGGSASRTSNPTPVLSGAPPAFRAVGTAASFTAATTVSLSPPPNTVTGELLIAFLTWGVSPGTVTAPAGWALAAGNTAPASGPSIAAYWHVAGTNEPATWAFDWTVAATGGGELAVFTGAGATAPIAAFTVGSTVVGSRSGTLPSVTTTAGYQRVVGFSSMNTASGWSTNLTGWSVRDSSFGSNPNGGLAERLATTAGATASIVWQNTTVGPAANYNSLSLTLAIAP